MNLARLRAVQRVQDAYANGEAYALEIRIRGILNRAGIPTDLLTAATLLSIAADQYGDGPPEELASMLRGLANASREALEVGELCSNTNCRAAIGLARKAAKDPKLAACLYCGTAYPLGAGYEAQGRR
jgi:hypothetical protein